MVPLSYVVLLGGDPELDPAPGTLRWAGLVDTGSVVPDPGDLVGYSLGGDTVMT